MDPRLLDPVQWERISRAMISLYAFVGLGLCAALAFLLGRGVIPSLADGGMGGAARALRWLLYPLGALALVLALVAFGRGLGLAVEVLESIYPRFLI